MQHIVDPRQTDLIDPFESFFSDTGRARLNKGWQGLFRNAILELMPVEILAKERHESLGRPSKELYSVAGLLFVMQFQNWTAAQAADAYMFDLGLQFALNLSPGKQSMSSRTLERYIKFFRDEEAAADIFDTVTKRLIGILDLNIREQRLDSTHVFSDMALFGRTQLMGVAVKRFLTQVKRHDEAAYMALSSELQARYAPSANHLFGDTARDSESRKLLRQQVAEDMYSLIAHFDGDPRHSQRSTYKNLMRVFEEQCEVEEEQVIVKKKTGGRVMQNPSDPDATYDGKKGPGYQAQLSETCSEDNTAQLITAAVAQTAAETDPESLQQVREELAANECLPETLLADAAYGSDDNVQESLEDGVELISPVNSSKRKEGNLHVEDFTIDAQSQTVQTCPAGHTPIDSVHDPQTGKTQTHMNKGHCEQCPNQERCPVKGKNTRTFIHTAATFRGGQRRLDEQTEAFKESYRKRAGVEGTISGMKRRVGLGRLRVRGRPAVFQAIYLKAAGWNILQAARSAAAQKWVAEQVKSTQSAISACLAHILTWRLLHRHSAGTYFEATQPRWGTGDRPATADSLTFVGPIFEGGLRGMSLC